MMQNIGQPIDIVYDEDFDFRKGNLIEVPNDFLQFLDRNQQFAIKGTLDDDMIVSTDDKTYKLRGVNLPTSMLLINQKGTVDLQLHSFIKLQDYDHQYHKIYEKIKWLTPEEQLFQSQSLESLAQKYGISDQQIRDQFKISLKQFAKFQQFLYFYVSNRKRLFVPVNVLLKHMRNIMLFLTGKSLLNQYFTVSDLNSSVQQRSDMLIDLIAKKFHFELQIRQQYQKMEVQGNKVSDKRYKITYQSILHFIIIQLSVTKNQYVASQMDDLIKGMLQVYIPIGMETPNQQQKKSLLKKVIARYFLQTTKNNTLLRIYYDPLEVESSLKGRIKFMSTFKTKFTKQQIRGVFEGLIIRQTSKEIKQTGQQGRKSIDMDDLLLKNFRKFNQLYEIKLILPK